MGTPGFAVASLEKLVNEKYNVVAVVTVPDKPAGRGQKLQESEVKQFAVQHSIPVLQPEKLKSLEFIEELKSFNPHLQIVVAFRMLPEIVWQLPPMGTFNLHGSLLPQYRGAAPINRAVMNGEKKTGVTTFFLQHKIDTGNIIFREEISIGENETAGEVHDRMMVVGAGLVTKTVDAILEGNYPNIPQLSLLDEGEAVHEAPKIFREDCKINWELPGAKIHNHIRGLSPYPAAWTNLISENEESIVLKIYRSEFIPSSHSHAAGKILENFHVATMDGMIRVLELQAPGKKKMPVADFLRGFALKRSDRVV
jgi:methionyl-tRNA formyltransferase